MATAKKPGKTAAGKPAGSGANFKKIQREAGGGEKGARIAAAIGQKKYGKSGMAKLAAKGRSRAAKGK
jgi:hypothetical protein